MIATPGYVQKTCLYSAEPPGLLSAPQTLSPTVAILHDLTDNCVSDRDACVDKLAASLARDIKTLNKDVETITQQINVRAS